ncbi:NAD(P)-dependent alcohol dehydrogenase [Chitinophaga filiformis]|uniref:NADPH:quinone reductase n=1 Tax=Chitinophaga filiformis TaxID=104663 RepID=A0A1G8C4P8_CHIFI|nr:NAD(P)-dependent alcohol dehydrogenase [Chitinophaga filiformis]SDH40506.1 NADPH:quinone reductase [Chitinophaga filiformis]
MKRVQFNHYGGAHEMYMGEYQLPQLKRDEVQVRVKAAAINPLDWKQRQGSMKLLMGSAFPKGIGSDFSGIVEAVGKDVSNIKVGDDVFGTMDVKKPGAFAEVLVTASRYVTKKPSHLSFTEAACLPIPVQTAWAAMYLKARVSDNSRILINGCTGAVGSMAVQLALAKGARVAGTCSQASMLNARLAGVDPVFNYADDEYRHSIEPFDVIFDTAGTLDVGNGLSMLKPKGVFIDINPTPKRMIRGLLSRRYKLVFATMATQHLPEIAALAAQGVLKSVIGLEAPFSDAVATITAVEKGQRVQGRVVLSL